MTRTLFAKTNRAIVLYKKKLLSNIKHGLARNFCPASVESEDVTGSTLSGRLGTFFFSA